MPWWMTSYVVLFAVVLVLDLFFSLRGGIKAMFFAYEVLSGVFLMSLMLAFWSPGLRGFIDLFTLAGFCANVGVDFYFSVWGDPAALGMREGEVSGKDFETAKAIGVLFNAPAYVIGGLLLVETLLNIQLGLGV